MAIQRVSKKEREEAKRIAFLETDAKMKPVPQKKETGGQWDNLG